jgi:hypothetical protein
MSAASIISIASRWTSRPTASFFETYLGCRLTEQIVLNDGGSCDVDDHVEQEL